MSVKMAISLVYTACEDVRFAVEHLPPHVQVIVVSSVLAECINDTGNEVSALNESAKIIKKSLKDIKGAGHDRKYC